MPVEKTFSVVDNKLQISSLTSYDAPLVKTYSLEELNSNLANAQMALKSWEYSKQEAEENIKIQTEQVASWQALIDEAVRQGVVMETEPDTK